MLSSKAQTKEKHAIQAINLDETKLQKGLAKLVLIIVELLRQILERQAQRRIESDELSVEEVERLGLAFMHMKEKISYISEEFGLQADELEGSLKGLMQSRDPRLTKITLVDVIDSLLSKGVLIGGRITISVADVELVALDLLATLSSISGTEKKTRNKRHD